jgi:HSP20 family protein
MADSIQVSGTDDKAGDERAEGTRTAPVIRPPADIHETKDGIVVELDMPGADPDSIDVNFERRTLTVSAQGRSSAPKGYSLVHQEFGDGDYERQFTVSAMIDAGKIDAGYRDGVLTLTLPYAKEAQARSIKVRTA